MKLLPEVLLNSCHIAPGIHAVSLDVADLFHVFTLCLVIALGDINIVCFIRALNDHCSHFLRRLDLCYCGLLLKSLRYYLRQAHVVNLLERLHFRVRNKTCL